MVTSNEKLMATAVIHSGSYGHFHTVGKVNNQSILFLLQHNACPEDEQLMWEAHASVPNFSLRKVYNCVSGKYIFLSQIRIYRVFFLTGTPPKNSKFKKVNLG